jgi:hypothetical protein
LQKDENDLSMIEDAGITIDTLLTNEAEGREKL